MGNSAAVYFNIHTAASVTACGRSSEAAAGCAFESFLANNVKFRSLDEIVAFINFTVKEKPNRKYKDKDILDADISLLDSFYKIMATCGHGYIPTLEHAGIVWDIMSKLSQEDLNRLYYKNNLYEFMDNSSMTNALLFMLQKLKFPFLNPNKVPDEIKYEMECFWSIIKEYVYSSYVPIDKIDRILFLPRKVTALMDTDSTILNLNEWYLRCSEKCVGIDMAIKHQLIDAVTFHEMDEFGDPKEPNQCVEFIDMDEDYDFYNDEILETTRLLDVVHIQPESGFRYSVVNILSYMCGMMVNDFILETTKRNYSFSPNRPCVLYMKNEFLFRTIMMTYVKKHYATYQEVQEGHLVPEDEALDIKGLDINKSTMSSETQAKMKSILFEEIIREGNVNQKEILKKLVILEKKIYNSLISGETKYYKPATVKSINTYDDPLRISTVKGCMVWNYMTDDNTEKFDLENRNSVLSVKINITQQNMDVLKEQYPDAYEGLIELMKNPRFANGINSICVPLGATIPEFVFQIIDYATIIKENLVKFPLESIGMKMLDDNVSYTNILQV